MFGTAFLPIGNNRTEAKHSEAVDSNTWKNVAIVAWTGTRGVVSLATALALPLTINDGPFPHRSLILFLAFVVIFVTLVIQGLSLPLLLKLLKVMPQDSSDRQEEELHLSIANSVLEFIDRELVGKIDETARNQIRSECVDVIESLSKKERTSNARKYSTLELSPVHELLKAQSEINRFQRKLLISYYKAGDYNHAIIRQFSGDCDRDWIDSLALTYRIDFITCAMLGDQATLDSLMRGCVRIEP